MGWIADYNRQWTYLMQATIAALCAFPLRRMVGWIPSITVFWFLAGAVATWQNSFNTYDAVDQTTLLAIQAFSLDSAVKLLLVVGCMFWIAKEFDIKEEGGFYLSLFCVLNSLWVIAQYVLDEDRCSLNTCGGLVGNPSMSGSILVTALPIAVSRAVGNGKIVMAALIVAAVIATKASSPLGLLIVAAALYLPALYAAAVLIGSLAFGYLLLGSELFNSGDRFEMWQQFLSGWSNKKNWVFGIGMGEFGVAAAMIQFYRNIKTNSWWLWAHNDWLQSLIEGGIVGMSLVVGTLVSAIRRADAPVRASMVLYAAMMLTNYPMHLATSAVLGCWLLFVALRRSDGEVVSTL